MGPSGKCKSLNTDDLRFLLTLKGPAPLGEKQAMILFEVVEETFLHNIRLGGLWQIDLSGNHYALIVHGCIDGGSNLGWIFS
jgi:hypothetical protein